jgi:hypothetical protein
MLFVCGVVSYGAGLVAASAQRVEQSFETAQTQSALTEVTLTRVNAHRSLKPDPCACRYAFFRGHDSWHWLLVKSQSMFAD